MRSFIRPVRVWVCACQLPSPPCIGFPSDLTLCVILVMKILRVITGAGPVPRVGSHKTHLDNQKAQATRWLFLNNVYIHLLSFQLLPQCLGRQHSNVKLLLAKTKKQKKKNPGISTSDFFSILSPPPNATTCSYELRDFPSWLWLQCSRHQRLGRP